MAKVEISDHLEDELEIAAEYSGRTKQEVAAEILEAHFADVSLPLSAFTEAELSRLMESIEQVKRGEVVTSEEVEARFDAWFAQRSGQGPEGSDDLSNLRPD